MSLINDALKRANEQKAKQPSAAELSEEMSAVEESGDQSLLWPIGLFAICLVGSLWFGWTWWHGSRAPEAIAADTLDVSSRENAPGAEEPVAEPEVASATTESTPETAPDESAPPESIPTAEAPPQPAAEPVRLPAATALPAATTAAAATPRIVLSPPPAPVLVPNVPPPTVPAPRRIPATASFLPQATVNARTPRNATAAQATPAPAPNPLPARQAQPVAPAAAPEPVSTTFPVLTLQGIYFKPSNPSAVINSRTVRVGDRIASAKVLAIDRHEVTVQWNQEVRVIGFR